MSRKLPFHRFTGSRTSIGRQHGESAATLIQQHVAMAVERLEGVGIDIDSALASAAQYRPFVQEHAPYFDDEIIGLAEGAELEPEMAYLLQLRAEVYADVLGAPEKANECTTFAVEPSAARGGVAIAGQNADLPHFYEDLMLVMDVRPDEGPDMLMATPAGQISYIGINSLGSAVFANFLNCDGWRKGFPRYLFSRFVLEHATVAEGLDALRALPRASSRNWLTLDAEGQARDLENTPERDALLTPKNGLLAHSNHYVSEHLQREERSKLEPLKNSRVRLQTIERLMSERHGELDPKAMATILRNREAVPDALSVESNDDQPYSTSATDRYSTVTSLIASPGEGRIWVTAGPPSRARYVEYSFEHGRHDDYAW